jgi:transaldolase
MKRIRDLRIKLFCDGADFDSFMRYYEMPHIAGFTTNPTLMRKSGINDYAAFARRLLAAIKDRPISFEVFADDIDGMERQARMIAGWGSNVYVKVPVTNTKGEQTAPLVGRLAAAGVKVNVTAVFTTEQVKVLSDVLRPETPSVVSVFAGRIADTGVDPMPLMSKALEILKPNPTAELLWASPRELLNIVQAEDIGCHIITATTDILAKLPLLAKDLAEYSRETVDMFYKDAVAAGYQL